MKQHAVAIIGMGSFFPRSPGLKEYWRLLLRGQDAIAEVPESHWSAADYFDPDPKTPDHVYCTRGGYLPPIPFDPSEFGIPPKNLEATDTSQLLALMAAKAALADAGYGENGREFDRNRASVILGVTGTQELVIPLSTRLGFPRWRRAMEAAGIAPDQAEAAIAAISDSYVSWQESSFPGLLGNVIAGRISNRLDLGGTNCAADAACASSMAAMHTALMEIATGRCDLAITGGADTLNDIFMHMCFSKTQILSASGDARPFSADADGTVLGEGIGLLVFKKLADAEKDGDRIYAVIRGMGTSSDGRSQSIYAPRADGQLRALKDAYARADLDPETVALIEAHGTGTRVGDMVEFQALRSLFNESVETLNQAKKCAIGSVKSMIGHTKAAAGAAGLIKAVLSLYHKVLPPTLKAEPVDPKLAIEQSRFYLNPLARPWFASEQSRRRCGVSSFGFGGSNFHMVLEEYGTRRFEIAWDGGTQILAFCGESRQALQQEIAEFGKAAADCTTEQAFAQLAGQSRQRFSAKADHRLVAVLEAGEEGFEPQKLLDEAVQKLDAEPEAETWQSQFLFYGQGETPGKLGFLFPGQGSQYVDMGRELACVFPQALEALETANRAFEKPLSDPIYPVPASDKKARQAQEEALRSTDVAQPAIGAISVAMLHILRDFGLLPDAAAGHSYGELVALYSAGRIDLESLYALSIARGRIMAEAGRAESGTMMAVKAPLEAIDQMIAEENLDLILANRNSPDQGVLSGSFAAIDQAQALCKQKKMRAIRLPVAAAFHSRLLKEAQKPFAEAVSRIEMGKGDIPVYSNKIADVYPSDSKGAKQLLADQLLSPVDFVNEVKKLFESGIRTFVEIGPKGVLTGLVKSILKGNRFHALSVDGSAGKGSGLADLARALGHLASLGYSVALDGWDPPPSGGRKAKMAIPICGANYCAKPSQISGAQARSGLSAASQTRRTCQCFASAKERKQEPQSREKIGESPSYPTAAPLATRAGAPEPGKAPPKQAGASQPPGQRTVGEVPAKSPPQPDKARDSAPQTSVTRQPPNGSRSIMNRPNPSSMVADAFKSVQEGMRSMQALQAQTAEAHKQFLETQSEASRSLQQMMDSTRRLTELSLGWEPSPAQGAVSPPAGPRRPQPDPSQPVANPASPATGPEPYGREAVAAQPGTAPGERSHSAASDKAGKAAAPSDRALSESPASAQGSGLRQTLLAVVSEQTGYPPEMLSVDMDIEADLGIDSIKRVEILSALEERVSGLPQVSPEVMGTLKTLAQILEYLGESSAAEPDTSSAGPYQSEGEARNASVASAPDPGRSGEIEEALLAVVSEQTGYPPEMLSMDMDIEADLGIDSIKRVEILSAFEERMPGIPQVSPEVMGTLKTLGQIRDYLLGPSPENRGVSEGNDALTESSPPALESPDSARTEPASPDSARAATPAGTETAEIQDILLAVVSDQTGYPSEMLSMDMDIEADLGIDSIKRVEILSAFEERMPGIPQVSPEVMGTLKTLGQIRDYLSGDSKEDPDGARLRPRPNNSPSPADSQNLTEPEPPDTDTVKAPRSEPIARQTVEAVDAPLSQESALSLPLNRPVLITGPAPGELGQALQKNLQTRGIPADCQAFDQIRQPPAELAGLVILGHAEMDARGLLQSFSLAHDLGNSLIKAAEAGGAVFATVSRMDGVFGFGPGAMDNPYAGGLAGLSKTAALEWPTVNCRALDIAAELADETAAEAIAQALLSAGPVEIGVTADKRQTLALKPSPVSGEGLNLKPGELVVISGGARGVTAQAALALAEAVQPVLLLIGRSPAPEPAPDWLAGITQPGPMKKAILEQEFSGQATPAQVEKRYRFWSANQAIQRNLEKLAQAGATVLYRAADVRDPMAVSQVIEAAKSEYGPVKGLIHGAGTLADRRIVDKTPEQFQPVFDTKVKGLENLLAAVEAEPLKYLILFSSVAARAGNQGQADYAMANEVLNKMARIQKTARPDCRVVSINWGPWDGGMVSPALRREFGRRGIRLIPLKAGAKALVAEMAGSGPAEVVLGAGLAEPSASVETKQEKAAEPRPWDAENLRLSFKREIDLERYPILEAHVPRGIPEVPFSLMTEWLGHGALHAHPGLFLAGLDELQLVNRIRMDQGKRLIRLLAGRAVKKEGRFEVAVELRDGVQEGQEVVHSRAKAILSNGPEPAPPFELPQESGSYGRPLNEVYEKILFQGGKLRGIQSITSCTAQGMQARVAAAPSPSQWMAEPLRSRWIADPLVLDSAFQMAILWCYEQMGAAALPRYCRSYRQYRNRFPSEGVTAVLDIRSADASGMTGDFTFVDEAGQVVATLTGYQAVADTELLKSRAA